MHRRAPLLFFGFLLFSCGVVFGQEPPPVTRAAPACPTTWTDHPIVPGVTPLRAQHIIEIRACIDFLRARGPDPEPPECEEDWSSSGRGEATVDVPQCINRLHVRVDHVGGLYTDFAWWLRDSLDGEWRRFAQGRVSSVDCFDGVCHWEGTYPIGAAVQVAVTMAGAIATWTVTRADD